jgi:glucose/arabinose dehydrogenase
MPAPIIADPFSSRLCFREPCRVPRLFLGCFHLLLIVVFGPGMFGEPARLCAQEVPSGFTAITLATNLNAATALTVAPDGRIFIAEQTGRLMVWQNGGLLETPALSLKVTDFWERGLIGLALHPEFPRTPHVFVLYVVDQPFVHHVLSRFELRGNVADPASEMVLLRGDDQGTMGGFQPAGHQGGPLAFGADGKLYVSVGEQTASAPSQRLDTLIGKILRLNPDGSIPEDNPFYHRTTGKYRAIYAIGVRNAFGLALQPETGRMFFTDVGGTAFDEVNELHAGANYGWPQAEGPSTQPDTVNPLYAYPPVVGRSIVGGVFYPRSPAGASAFPERWRGQFFFADFMNHWVKALDPESPAKVVTFARGFNGPVALEIDTEGALLVLNRGAIWRDPKRFVPNAGSLVRIAWAPAAHVVKAERPAGKAALDLPASYSALPRKLSETALVSLARGQSIPGVEPFALNVPAGEPGVTERLWLALPAGARLGFHPTEDWSLPAGGVVVRHFQTGDRPLETRLVVAGDPCGYAVSYRWSADGADADLVEDFELVDIPMRGGRRPVRQWYFAPPEECLVLPTSSPAFALPLNTRQLNRTTPGGVENQLQRLQALGWIELPPSVVPENLPRLAALENTGASLEIRARSYLDVRCAICHQPGGSSRGAFDARFHTPLSEAGLMDGELAAGDLGIAGARVVVPGEPGKSILLRRMQATDFFRMPPVAYHDEPSPAVPVLTEWIKNLK